MKSNFNLKNLSKNKIKKAVEMTAIFKIYCEKNENGTPETVQDVPFCDKCAM
jgi:hypothetical protein